MAKLLIEAIDEEKKSIKFKMLDGDLMVEYEDYTITLLVETKGDIDLVTLTLEYVRLNDVPHPIPLLASLMPQKILRLSIDIYVFLLCMVIGIPGINWSGVDWDDNVLVLDLLGPRLP
ncbi:Polyketide cyclase/dehydrase and lipid transportsuperfamily protein [Forsythia ovata]|uniref:Polyketide cyclase/dehydrase and lipid transportsuperfamily protein n=1 Tax=Forsythia ovata TaxID=205694 RepID=A0ABD1WZS2_9LAMI